MADVNETINKGDLLLRDPNLVDTVFRDAFIIHASLSEIVLEFGTLDKGRTAESAEGQSGVARERVALTLAAAVQFSQSLSRTIEEIRKATLALAQTQQSGR